MQGGAYAQALVLDPRGCGSGHLTSHKELWGVTIPFTTDDTYVVIYR